MARPSKLPELEALVSERLSDLDEEFERQPPANRNPTLPLTEDGKVNVRAFTVDVCGLPRSAEQHFFKKPTLAALVNAAAMRQGVNPIGSRMLSDVADRGVRDRIARIKGERDDHARTLAEREAVIERLRRENASLRERLRLVEETGMLMREPLPPC